MRIYIDMSALKRPFDAPSLPRIEAEAEAILKVLERVEAGNVELLWSTALSYENNADPDDDVRAVVARYARLAIIVRLSPPIIARIRSLASAGLAALDASHLAFAESASCNALITCDDRLIRRARKSGALIPVLAPLVLQRYVFPAELAESIGR